MITFIYKQLYKRLIFGITAGFIGYLFIILTFSLQYRYYTVPFGLADILTFTLAGIAMTESIVLANRWLDRKITWASNPFKRFGVQLVTGIVITLVLIVVLRIAGILLFFPGRLIIFSDEVVKFLVVLFLVLVFDFIELGIFLIRNYRNSLAELERFRKENVEYQFEMLKLQLNPHFLFNSLNTLSSLVYEDTEKSAEFIRKLSDVYRYVLDNRDRELVSLKQEMEFISAFTFLLGIRFQEMVFFKVDIRKDAMSKQIAPMTVQLLVENAVKHNVASKGKPLTIEISTENDVLWVMNNLQLKHRTENTGVGLKNIKSRYSYLTDRRVEIIQAETSFKVKIPLIG
jgi:sensor histidine kinase YesM